ncbi:hypothetical protein HHK36_013998 [Tetracentron sinense]|uniref:DUF642 domain-containing protein n=1 Tax=Tetracentron sinense TaxID=13715 RepID=A0A835DDV1_TETSI|nr:hypothetical protein HHK36_013998 [Tetracentron sinense]
MIAVTLLSVLLCATCHIALAFTDAEILNSSSVSLLASSLAPENGFNYTKKYENTLETEGVASNDFKWVWGPNCEILVQIPVEVKRPKYPLSSVMELGLLLLLMEGFWSFRQHIWGLQFSEFLERLLPNGNFEYGPKPSQMKGTVVIGPNAIPNWETSGFVEYIKSGQKQGDMLLVVPEGAFAVRLGNEASIKQKVKVIKGMYYSITFSAARTCAQEEKLNISVAPDSGVLPMQTMYSSNGWDSYAWAFQADYPEVEIVIHNPGVEEDPACGPLIDSIAMKALYPPRLTNKNMLKNGDFEEGPYVFPNTSWGVLVPPNIEDDHSPLPGWMIESLKAVKYIDSAHFSVPEGKRAVELVAGKESAIAQVARTVPGKFYTLTFAVGDASNSCEGSMVVEAFAGQDTIKVPYKSKGKGGFKRAVLRFKAISTHTRVMFLSTFYSMTSDNSGSLCGPVIDDVKLLGVRNAQY